MKFTSKNIRNSAKGQKCTVNIPGVCNYDPETTVYCHIAADGGKMGGKADDVLGGYYGCDSCHSEMDGRTNQLRLNKWEKLWYEYRAVRRTWRTILGEFKKTL